MQHLIAARLRLPAGAAFSGLTAAWLHGLDVRPCDPIEATVPIAARVSARSGIALRRSTIEPADVVVVRGLPATTPIRTISELCCRLDVTEAVVIADAALHQRLVQLEPLSNWVESHAGHRGIRKLRRVLGLVEPGAESPMESRLRMLLLLAGLPRPRVQVSIHDGAGRFAGRPDLYYERQRLGLEYDGGHHRSALTEDNRRQNRLLDAGVRLLRFTAADVLGNPGSVVMRVRAQLTDAPHFARPPAMGRLASDQNARPPAMGRLASDQNARMPAVG